MTLTFNQPTQFLLDTQPMSLVRAENNQSLETLRCRLVEINEEQTFEVPTFPTDDGEFRNDTIWRNPQNVSVRVFVEAEDIPAFESNIKEAQFSAQTFSLFSMYNKVYNNLKVLSYSRELNSSMLGACHFWIDLQEIIFVRAIAQSYKMKKNSGYSNKRDTGTKTPQTPPKSTLKGFYS